MSINYFCVEIFSLQELLEHQQNSVAVLCEKFQIIINTFIHLQSIPVENLTENKRFNKPWSIILVASET